MRMSELTCKCGEIKEFPSLGYHWLDELTCTLHGTVRCGKWVPVIEEGDPTPEETIAWVEKNRPHIVPPSLTSHGLWIVGLQPGNIAFSGRTLVAACHFAMRRRRGKKEEKAERRIP